MSWSVIYTKSRSEKVVAEKLSQAGFKVYCPLLKTKRLWSDRWKWVEEPLFRSYCFVNVSGTDRENVLFVPGVVRYIFHCGKPAVIRDSEMEQLQNWLNTYKHESFTTTQYNIDDKVRFRSGALIDKQGAVVESRGNFATLYLEDLGVQVRVDLRKNLVEKL